MKIKFYIEIIWKGFSKFNFWIDTHSIRYSNLYHQLNHRQVNSLIGIIKTWVDRAGDTTRIHKDIPLVLALSVSWPQWNART